MDTSDNVYDWTTFSAPTLNKTMGFKREIFNDIINMIWAEYRKDKDESVFVAYFLCTLEDFPEIKQLYEKYMDEFEHELWSDKKMIMRFLVKISILYENLEVQTKNV